MRPTYVLSAAAIAVASVVIASPALAYGEGDFFTRLGAAKVNPKSDNGEFNGDLAGADVEVDDDTGFAFTLGYRFTDKLGVELLAALPFEHDVNVGGGDIASTKHLPPTLTAQYYPLGGTDSRVQPYVGAGINYTRFFDEEVDVAGADLELDDSWGLAGQVGIDLLIDEHWALNAAAWYIDIDTDASVSGSVNADADVEIDPLVVMGGISYRF